MNDLTPIPDRAAWLRAQQEERRIHNVHIDNFKQGYADYEATYVQYFEKLQTSSTQFNKTILEIGPADYPALGYCSDYKRGYIIEPLPSDILKTVMINKPITLYECAAEDVDFPQVDECWLLNVLQHTINPALIIDKAKRAAKVIRFFEPINDGVDVCHLHSFTMEYFEAFFGAVVKNHPASKGIMKNFHEHECAYGVWNKWQDKL